MLIGRKSERMEEICWIQSREASWGDGIMRLCDVEDQRESEEFPLEGRAKEVVLLPGKLTP